MATNDEVAVGGRRAREGGKAKKLSGKRTDGKAGISNVVFIYMSEQREDDEKVLVEARLLCAHPT